MKELAGKKPSESTSEASDANAPTEIEPLNFLPCTPKAVSTEFDIETSIPKSDNFTLAVENTRSPQ